MSVDDFIEQGKTDFRRDFIRFLKARAVARGFQMERLNSYISSDTFRDLNRKYNGRGVFYLGIVLHEMLCSKQLRFKPDDHAGDFYILDKE